MDNFWPQECDQTRRGPRLVLRLSGNESDLPWNETRNEEQIVGPPPLTKKAPPPPKALRENGLSVGIPAPLSYAAYRSNSHKSKQAMVTARSPTVKPPGNVRCGNGGTCRHATSCNVHCWASSDFTLASMAKFEY